MGENNIYAAISSLISIASLILLSVYGYRRLRIDHFRQEMFILRDRLFIEAGDGLIEYNHPAYGLMRQTINGYIRFGHDLSLLNIVINEEFFRFEMPDSMTFNGKWKAISAGLPEQTQRRLAEFREEMMMLVVGHLLYGSVLAAACTLVVKSLIVLYIAIRALVENNPLRLFAGTSRMLLYAKFKPRISGIDDLALVAGQ